MRLENPPVVERVLTLQFLPLEDLDVVHIGLWWSRIRERFPQFSRQNVLSRISETFPFRNEPPRIQLGLDSVPRIPRCVFAADGGDYGRLLQLQPDRFTMNLRRDHGHSYLEYPEFSQVFLDEFTHFERFCEEQRLEKPDVTLGEVIYVNRIDCEQRNLLHRWNEVFAAQQFAANTSPELPTPSFLSHNAVYDYPNDRGRLRIEASSADHREKPAILVKLTGRINMDAQSDPQACLLKAHDWVVDAFKNITSESIRTTEWGQQC